MKKYPGMRKLYYKLNRNSELSQSKADDFRNSYSSITPEFTIKEFPSFIMHCDEILDKVRCILTVSRAIDILDRKLPHKAKQQFLRRALIEEIQQTNETENVHSTRKEIRASLDAINLGKRGQRFDGMIRKYQLLLSKTKITLESCQDVRTLYDEFILDEVLKENPQNTPDGLYFRQGPVFVRNKHDIVVHEGVFPEKAVNESMEHALSFLNDSGYDPFIRIAVFHFMFAYIHPFYDGNGRMSRFISSAKLRENDIHLLVALRLSYVIKNNRNKYYALFRETNDKHNYGDMTLFVIGFLDFVLEACTQVSEYLQDKNEGIEHYFDVLNQMDLSKETKDILSILIQVSICEGESLNITSIEHESNISKYQINKHMSELEPLCVVDEKGRSRLFRADLTAFDEWANQSPKQQVNHNSK